MTMLLVLATAGTGAAAAPFPTRDQNPFLTGFGLPQPLSARAPRSGEWRLAADLNWSSVSTADSTATEALLVDTESRELRLSAERGLSERIALRLQLPYRHTGAGVLDGFIDSFHGLFGLPEGSRDDLPRDALRMLYMRDGVLYYDRSDSASGIGDLSMDVGYRLLETPAAALAAWFTVKLPTGSARKLTGSGGTDIALSLAAERKLGERGSLFGQISLARLSEGEVLHVRQHDVAWSAMTGAGYRVWRGLTLKAQLDTHSAVYRDTQVDFLRSAVVLTLGGHYRFQSGWQLDIGVSEDVDVGASPDVVFVFGLRRWK